MKTATNIAEHVWAIALSNAYGKPERNVKDGIAAHVEAALQQARLEGVRLGLEAAAKRIEGRLTIRLCQGLKEDCIECIRALIHETVVGDL